MFLGFLAAGAFLGVVIPVIADGSLRLAGIGLPAGLIFGLIVYVTVDLLLTPTAGADISEEGAAVESATEGGGRRQLLLLTLFAAIVAHFFEIHLGIAIASTLTTFWVLAAVLVAVGMGWANPTEEVPDTVRGRRAWQRRSTSRGARNGCNRDDERQTQSRSAGLDSHGPARRARFDQAAKRAPAGVCTAAARRAGGPHRHALADPHLLALCGHERVDHV